MMLPVHIVLTGMVLFVIGLITVVLASTYEGFFTAVWWFAMSAVAAAVTTTGAIVAGLPLRIAPTLREWWVTHGGVVWLIALAALGCLAASFFVGGAGSVTHPASFGQPEMSWYEPDWVMFAVGWFSLAFTLSHIWWPMSWRSRPLTGATLSE